MSPDIALVGCGPGHRDLATAQALWTIADAKLLVGSPRLLATFAPGGVPAIPATRPTEMESILRRRPERPAAVLVSGDPTLCSAAQGLGRLLPPGSCRIVPGLSCVQLACARLGIDSLGLRVFSSHDGGDIPDLDLAGCRAAILLGGGRSSRAAAEALRAAAGGGWTAAVCRNLSYEDESIEFLHEGEPAGERMEGLSLLALWRT
jgi:precorrin-6y C5,15-methyltransferase (decarboxylating) CbiE subunit